MFNLKYNECVGFESRWTVKKVSEAGSSQTTEFSTIEKDIATTETKTIETQTEEEEQVKPNETDYEKLAAWLNKIYPSVHKELNKSQRAFKTYRLLDDLKDVNSRIVQTVNLFPITERSDNLPTVSSISWNASGKILGVACAYSHETWCFHESFVTFFLLDKDDKLSKIPNIKISVENCVVILCFHPSLPNVVAGGTYAGKILIWNVENENEQALIEISAHNQGITYLTWVNHSYTQKPTILASSSLDGFIKLWDFNYVNATLILTQRFTIKTPILARTVNATLDLSGKRSTLRGIICFDFSKFDPDIFVVGTEGGLVVQCTLLGATPLKGNTTDEPLSDPACKYHSTHSGEIVSINFSPNRKEMFMTNCTDGEIRIYLIDQEEPAQVLFMKQQPLNCVSWIPFEEKIIGGCGKKGVIEVFTLIDGKPVNNPIKEKVAVANIIQMDVCRIRNHIVATGTEKGEIQVWNVPWNLLAM